tara:strand:- start:369 stop:503 length:135 start_codon:yes stop_codon:yes gene_type:complete
VGGGLDRYTNSNPIAKLIIKIGNDIMEDNFIYNIPVYFVWNHFV